MKPLKEVAKPSKWIYGRQDNCYVMEEANELWVSSEEIRFRKNWLLSNLRVMSTSLADKRTISLLLDEAFGDIY